MRNHDALEDADFRRSGRTLPGCVAPAAAVRSWYEAPGPGGADRCGCGGPRTVFQQAMRPFLTRAPMRSWRGSIELAGGATCPLCAGEPDLAIITPAAERLLICARCARGGASTSSHARSA